MMILKCCGLCLRYSQHKFNVLRFSNARDALQSLGHQLPALIISDIMMPEIDGYSFTQKIKKDQLWNHIPGRVALCYALQRII